MVWFHEKRQYQQSRILNAQFKYIFNEEDSSNMPYKGESPYRNANNIEVNEKGALKFPQNLRPNKAT